VFANGNTSKTGMSRNHGDGYRARNLSLKTDLMNEIWKLHDLEMYAEEFPTPGPWTSVSGIIFGSKQQSNQFGLTLPGHNFVADAWCTHMDPWSRLARSRAALATGSERTKQSFFERVTIWFFGATSPGRKNASHPKADAAQRLQENSQPLARAPL
jgi:hypothetical protein